MKKQQNNSIHAWALLVALSIALLSISAVLLAAASFKATPATSGLSTPITPVAAGDKDLVIAGPASGPEPLSRRCPVYIWQHRQPQYRTSYHHTATLLPSGKVLAPGGAILRCLASAELYDSSDRDVECHWQPHHRTRAHTATLLPNGQVLVAGGAGSASGALSSAELYDPALGTWSATGSLTTARIFHTATLLPNGKVLVAGGSGAAPPYQRGTGRPSAWDVECHWQPHHRTRSITRRRCCPTARCWWLGEINGGCLS